jgi:HAL2 family 3'(2'),5'-bisphosphate nucleotidase
MTIMTSNYENERSVAINAVREAARLCQTVAGAMSPGTLAKKDKSPVTVADFGGQALICRTLARAFPDDPVIAEEDSADLRLPENAAALHQVCEHVRAVLSSGGNARDRAIDSDQDCRWIDHGGGGPFSRRFWTLDPIDGTKGFLRGEQYAIALALIIEGRVAVAALACPNLPESGSARHDGIETPPGAIFHAVSGHGAFFEPLHSSEQDPRPAPPLAVSNRGLSALARFCESVESGHSAQGDSAALAAFLGITAPPVRMDSQAKYAVVARGEADIYLRLPTRADYREKIWDHAAGALIVTEAGGIVSDINGHPLEFNHGRELAANRGVIVSNTQLHQSLINAIKQLSIGQEVQKP